MKRHFQAFSMAAILIVFLSGIATAQPSEKPQQFYGTVTVNGAPAPDGMLVSAKFNGKDVGGTLTSGGNYNLIIAMNENDEGQAVSFYVQNVNTGIQSTFQGGSYVRLDLSATIATPPPSGGGGSTGGGSSGGGSGGGGGSGTCTESWICTDWTECSNYVQKRVCADVNRCGTNSSKPVESQDCTMPIVCQAGQKVCTGDKLMVCSALGTTWIEEKTCQQGCSNGVCNEDLAAAGPALAGLGAGTGLFLLEPSAWPYWLAVVVLAALLVWFFLRRRKRPAEAQPKE